MVVEQELFERANKVTNTQSEKGRERERQKERVCFSNLFCSAFRWESGSIVIFIALCFTAFFHPIFERNIYAPQYISYKSVFSMPNDVSVVNFSASSEQRKSLFENVSKVVDESCWKSLFEQNETNFF